MGTPSRLLLVVAKTFGPGILSYVFVRILIGAGVPLDTWGVSAGQFLGAHMSAQTATWMLILIIGILLWSAEWWFPRLWGLVFERWGQIPIFDAGRWLYDHGNETTRAYLKAGVPYPFKSISQHGASFFVEAARKGVGVLYGRPEAGFSRARITPDDADTISINPDTGEGDKHGHSIDIAVTRSDLRKVLRWYEADHAERTGKIGRPARAAPAPSADRAVTEPAPSRLLTIITNGLWELHFKSTHPGARKTITFLPDGTVGEGRNQNEHTWKLERDILTITRADGSLQNRFTFNSKADRLVSINDTNAVGNQNQTIYRP